MDTQALLQSGLADRYALERELGRGGMAVVYLARDLKHDRPVALKVLLPELAASLGAERFQREIRLAARLQHPHILAVHDSGETSGRLWFTMPYVDGESLRDRLRREGRLPVDEALRITRDAARGAAVRPRARGDPPRREAGEPAPHPGRQYPGRRLRDRPRRGRRREHHQGRRDDGHAGLHEPRAGGWGDGGGCPDRHLLAGRGALRDAGRRAALPRHDRDVGDREMAERAGAERAGGPAGSAGGGGPGAPPRVVAVGRRAVRDDGGVRSARWSTRAHGRRGAGVQNGWMSSRGLRVRACDPASRASLRLPAWAALAIALLAARLLRLSPSRVPSPPKLLAVLPFENLGDSADAYFADGIANELRSKLSELSGVQVIARGSSNQYRGSTKPPEEIARELGVSYLLTATVQWDKARQAGAPSRVRVIPGAGGGRTIARRPGPVAAPVRRGAHRRLRGAGRHRASRWPTSSAWCWATAPADSSPSPPPTTWRRTTSS